MSLFALIPTETGMIIAPADRVIVEFIKPVQRNGSASSIATIHQGQNLGRHECVGTVAYGPIEKIISLANGDAYGLDHESFVCMTESQGSAA